MKLPIVEIMQQIGPIISYNGKLIPILDVDVVNAGQQTIVIAAGTPIGLLLALTYATTITVLASGIRPIVEIS